MREILFRGKELIHKQWIYGYYFHTPEFSLNQHSMLNADDWLDVKSVIPETIGQYTGLTDKHGTRIFEGDILEGDLDDNLDPGAKWRSEIVWGKFGWMCKVRQTLPMDEFDIREGEVIGNIHDNPELLEETK